jgi:hypothetical protein
MKTQQRLITDRRHHPRQGIFAEIENVTYRVLRRYGINSPTDPYRPRSTPEKTT